MHMFGLIYFIHRPTVRIQNYSLYIGRYSGNPSLPVRTVPENFWPDLEGSEGIREKQGEREGF